MKEERLINNLTSRSLRVEADVTHKMIEKAHTRNLAYSNAHDPEPVVRMFFKEPIFSGINLGIIGDLQNGVVGVNEGREKKSIEFWEKTCNCILTMNGDNNDIPYDPYQAKFDNEKSIGWNIDKYRKLANQGKLISANGGNHDCSNAKRNVKTGFSAVKHISDALNIVFAEFAIFITGVLPSNDTLRKPQTLKIIEFHGAGKLNGKAASIDNAYDQIQNFVEYIAKPTSPEQEDLVPDVIILNHYHTNVNGKQLFRVPQYNKQGEMIGFKYKEITIIVESSIQELARYALAMALPPVDSNIYINHLSFDKNPYYTSKTKDMFYEYTLNVTRIPMFKNNSNAYTKEALDYMKQYCEPYKLEENIRKEYMNLNYEQSINRFKEEITR